MKKCEKESENNWRKEREGELEDGNGGGWGELHGKIEIENVLT